MNTALIARAGRLGLTVAGSVLAVPEAERVAAGAALTEARSWTHADIMTGPYRGQPGILPAAIGELAEVPGVSLDVHVMSDRLGEVIDELGDDPLARLTVQVRDAGEAEGALALGTAAERWLAIDPEVWIPDPALLEPWDGVLVMLTAPGQPGRSADLGRLSTVESLARMTSVGVDGGVTDDSLDAIAEAGAGFVVVGRALFA